MFLDLIDFHGMNGLHYVFFCVLRKKESNTKAELSFLGEPLRLHPHWSAYIFDLKHSLSTLVSLSFFQKLLIHTDMSENA